MDEPTGCAGCWARAETYCDRCDLLVGLPGLRVVDVAADDRAGGGLRVTVESPPVEQGCRVCGVIAAGHGRRTVWLVDAPPVSGGRCGWRGGSGAGYAASRPA